MKRQQLIDIIASLFILLFVYTAINKLAGIGVFQAVLRRSPLIGSMYVLVSWAIPFLELGIALLLLLPAWRRAGLWASLVLMCVFTLYLGYMLLFTPDLPCSCGGVIRKMSWTQHLFFNLFFVSIAILGLRLHPPRCSSSNPVIYSAMG